MPGPGRFHSNLNYVLKIFCEGDQKIKFQGQRSHFRKLIENGKLSHNEISVENPWEPLGT